MALTSKISLYDSRWPALFLSAKEQIAKAFGTELVAIHHVGSTAVPGLAAKPEIDLLVEVSEHRNESSRDHVMRGSGYARGSDLSAGHHFYRRDVDGVRTHKTHVCITDHGQIERMLRFRDLLRGDPVIRQRYQDLKLELAASNTGGIGEYLAQKAPFIDGLMGSVSTSGRRGAAGCNMEIRLTKAQDWMFLKQVRLAALLDTPTAFGVSYQTAANYSDEQWKERASSAAGPEFWLAIKEDKPVGMIGGGVSQANRYNLIGMWVEPAERGSGMATQLVEAVKSRAIRKGHDRVFLDVSADNTRASNFYLKQGFSFIDEWEHLASHPHIMVQTMLWTIRN
jgi:GrpB-like predicted nucleotidyltransferase (UPF0157 family)/ribosomal protein S18 acetylase RimI-like enzyme